MKRWLPPAVLTALFVLFRVPALLNPGLLNSDGAIAGLQARRILEGEWQWLHWGRDYLTSLDSVVAAPFFALFGATPLVLMCVTLLGQLTGAWLACAIVSRRLGPWPGFVVSLPLVFMTMAANIYLFYGVRQWCLALMLFACWILDRAPESTRPRTLLVLSMVVTFVAMFVDLFAVQFIPGMILFGVLSALDGSRKIWPRVPQLAAVLAGILLGIVALRLLRAAANAQTGRGNLDLSLVTTHWPLLIEQCLPWLVGARLFVIDPTGNLVAAPFPPWFLPLQIAGALVFAGALISGAALFFVQRIPWRVRVLGAVGSGVAFTSLCGFLGSAAAVDIMAARLLLPVVLTLPFTLAPLAWLAGKRLPLVLLPWLLSAAIAGWLSYGAMVDGLVPRRTVRGAMTDERAVGDFLRHRGIRYAAADYWIAYRLTFILEENPIVVPEASEDRYPRWRTEFDAAPLVAYLVHQSGEDLTSEMVEARLAGKPFEKVSVQGFTVIIVDQAPAK